jgi:hypothetical protein
MNFLYWGGKTLYYSLINKAGSKVQEDVPLQVVLEEYDEEADCESCKL